MKFEVNGFRRIKVIMQVEAKDAAEAIALAQNGVYDHVDTEPDCDLTRPKWTARALSPHGEAE